MRLNQQGAILLIVLIVVLTISIIGASLIALFYSVYISSQTELDRARALYLAEAGVAQAIHMLRKPPAPAPPGAPAIKDSQRIVPPTQLGEGYFEVYCDFSQSAIISIGTSHGVRRIIQVKYEAF